MANTVHVFSIIHLLFTLHLIEAKPRKPINSKNPFGCLDFKRRGYQTKCIFENYFRFLQPETCHVGYSIEAEEDILDQSGKKCADLGIEELDCYTACFLKESGIIKSISSTQNSDRSTSKGRVAKLRKKICKPPGPDLNDVLGVDLENVKVLKRLCNNDKLLQKEEEPQQEQIVKSQIIRENLDNSLQQLFQNSDNNQTLVQRIGNRLENCVQQYNTPLPSDYFEDCSAIQPLIDCMGYVLMCD